MINTDIYEKLTPQQIIEETDRLIKIVAWEKSEEGMDYHLNDVRTGHPCAILGGALEALINDGIDRGWNPTYLIGYLAMRIAGQHPDLRDGLSKLIPNYDALTGLPLELRGD